MSAFPEAPPGPAGLAPPHSLEAEQAVLGAIMLSDRAMYPLVIDEGLKPEDFYRERHRVVYAAMVDLYERSEPIDVLTLTDHLQSTGNLEAAGGEQSIDALTGPVPAAGHLRQYARIVREHALLRRLLDTTYEVQTAVAERRGDPREIVERAERMMLEVAHDDRQKEFRKVEEILHEELIKLQKLSREGTALTGTPTGFKDLDELTGGFQPGNLIILAARPSMGKCLVGPTLVHDPMSGARRRLDEVVRAVERGDEAWVASLGPDLRLRPTKVSASRRSGRLPVLCVTTTRGRRTTGTASHPLLTMAGWKRIDELRPGDRIAVPRSLPRRGRPATMPDHELVLPAALVADGNLASRTPRSPASATSPMVGLVRHAARAMGCEVLAAAGHPRSHNRHVGARGAFRPRPERSAASCGDPVPADLATSDLRWDEIASIEPAGEAETYDIEVPGDHNFVADDIVVHNSALVTNIAENTAIEHDKAVALFSLEMSEGELAQRFVASQARVRGEDLRRGRVADHKWPKILEASSRLARAPLFVDDSSDIGLLEVRAKARRLHQQHGLSLVIVDYLQLMRADHAIESRVQQVGEISRGLKILARELEVPVVALSQLSRAVESRNPPIPQLSDLRESGNIEQDADLVAFLYRPEYYERKQAREDDEPVEREGEADVIIGKHRNGGLGTVTLTFLKEYPKFLNYAGADRYG